MKRTKNIGDLQFVWIEVPDGHVPKTPRLDAIIERNGLTDSEDWNPLIFEPREIFDKGLVGLSEDDKLVYSFQRLKMTLTEFYMQSSDDLLGMDPITANESACGWLDHNTIPSMHYMDPDQAPIILHELDEVS